MKAWVVDKPASFYSRNLWKSKLEKLRYDSDADYHIVAVKK